MKRYLSLLITMFFIFTLIGCDFVTNNENNCDGKWDEETKICTTSENPNDNTNNTCENCLSYDLLTHIELADWQIKALTENKYERLLYFDEDVMLFENRGWIEVTENGTTQGSNHGSGEFLAYDKVNRTVQFEANNNWWQYSFDSDSISPTTYAETYSFKSTYIGNKGFIVNGKFYDRTMNEINVGGYVLSYYPYRDQKVFYIQEPNDFNTASSLVNPMDIKQAEFTNYSIGERLYNFFDIEVYTIIDKENHNKVMGYFSEKGDLDSIGYRITLDDFIPEGATNVTFFDRTLIGFRESLNYQYTLNGEDKYISFSPDLTKYITMTSNQNNDFVYLSNDYAIFHDDELVTIYDTDMTFLQSFDFGVGHINSVRAQIINNKIILNLDDEHVIVDTNDWSYIMNDGYAYAYMDYVILAPQSGPNQTYHYYNKEKQLVALPDLKEVFYGSQYFYIVQGGTFEYTNIDVYDYSGEKINTLNYVIRYSNHFLKQFIVEVDGEYYLCGNLDAFITK